MTTMLPDSSSSDSDDDDGEDSMCPPASRRPCTPPQASSSSASTTASSYCATQQVNSCTVAKFLPWIPFQTCLFIYRPQFNIKHFLSYFHTIIRINFPLWSIISSCQRTSTRHWWGQWGCIFFIIWIPTILWHRDEATSHLACSRRTTRCFYEGSRSGSPCFSGRRPWAKRSRTECIFCFRKRFPKPPSTRSWKLWNSIPQRKLSDVLLCAVLIYYTINPLSLHWKFKSQKISTGRVKTRSESAISVQSWAPKLWVLIGCWQTKLAGLGHFFRRRSFSGNSQFRRQTLMMNSWFGLLSQTSPVEILIDLL